MQRRRIVRYYSHVDVIGMRESAHKHEARESSKNLADIDVAAELCIDSVRAVAAKKSAVACTTCRGTPHACASVFNPLFTKGHASILPVECRMI